VSHAGAQMSLDQTILNPARFSARSLPPQPLNKEMAVGFFIALKVLRFYALGPGCPGKLDTAVNILKDLIPVIGAKVV
jgi:hypothetical protein